MTKMISFDRRNIVPLQMEIQAALDAVAVKYGIQIQAPLTGGRMSPEEFTLKLSCTLSQEQQKAIADGDRVLYERYADSLGLKVPFGHVFTFGRHKYKINGVRPAATSRPVTAERVDNQKTYLFSVSDVTLFNGGKRELPELPA